MRIGIEGSAASNKAGSGVLTRHLIQELGRLGHTVIPFTAGRHPGPAARPSFLRRLLNGLGQIGWMQASLPRVATKENIDLLVCPAQLGPLRLSKPVVLLLYDLSFLLQPKTTDLLFGLYLRRLVPRLIKRARCIVVISEATLTDLASAFPEAVTRAVVALPGPGEAEAMLSEARRTNHAPRPQHYVLMVGTLEPRKNHVRALEAFRLFRNQSGQDWQMLIVGSPGWSYAPILQGARGTGLGEAVTFLGHVSLGDLGALYQQAGALFFPSLKEGFGLPILEAMALGCPVVTSNCSAMAEVGDGAAQLVDPLDVRSMADGLQAVLTDQERRSKLILRGKIRAEQFSWQSFGKVVESSILAATAGVP